MDLTIPLVLFMAHNSLNWRALRPYTRSHRRPQSFRQRLTLDNFTNEEAMKHFRIPKSAIQELYNQIKGRLQRKSRQCNAIPGQTKLISVLHYLASGSFQYCIGSKMGFTQSTFSKILRQVVEAIDSVSTQNIKFLYQPQDQARIKERFYTKYGIPQTIGLIDCTHVALLPPNAVEASYRNRKHYHSLNVQVICGPLVARYPGGTHDSFILGNSGIGTLFELGFFGNSILLGDNGYRLTLWLLTPYLNPQTESQQRYNLANRKTRSQIERVFGQLKSRFHCLDVTGGAMLYHPTLVDKIVLACSVLHNIALQNNHEVEIAGDIREEIECLPAAGYETSQVVRKLLSNSSEN